jgi:hypothetical protein
VQHQIAIEKFEHSLFLRDGSPPATTVATVTSQRLLKARDSTDFADGAPTL